MYIALNKPVGITCTSEKAVKGNIIDLVNHPLRINHIGRLDKDSDGLILLRMMAISLMRFYVLKTNMRKNISFQ